MAKSCYRVELDDKEVRDALIEAAKKVAGIAGINTSSVQVYTDGSPDDTDPLDDLAAIIEFTNLPRKS